MRLTFNFTQNMKESKNRTEQFMYTTQTAANHQTPSRRYHFSCRTSLHADTPFQCYTTNSEPIQWVTVVETHMT